LKRKVTPVGTAQASAFLAPQIGITEAEAVSTESSPPIVEVNK